MLVENAKYLVVQCLVHSNTFNHLPDGLEREKEREGGKSTTSSAYLCTYHSLGFPILPVHFVHTQQVVAEVERLKLPLLSQESDDDTACPLQALTAPLSTHNSKSQLN